MFFHEALFIIGHSSAQFFMGFLIKYWNQILILGRKRLLINRFNWVTNYHFIRNRTGIRNLRFFPESELEVNSSFCFILFKIFDSRYQVKSCVVQRWAILAKILTDTKLEVFIVY